MSEAPTEPVAPITIEDQIEEVRKEISMRERVYPEWVKTGRYKPDTANRKLAVLRKVMNTLEWLRDNRAWIHEEQAARRERAHWRKEDAKREAARDPLVKPILDAIPGTTIADVRPMEGARA
jgi:hypothetical protein